MTRKMIIGILLIILLNNTVTNTLFLNYDKTDKSHTSWALKVFRTGLVHLCPHVKVAARLDLHRASS